MSDRPRLRAPATAAHCDYWRTRTFSGRGFAWMLTTC